MSGVTPPTPTQPSGTELDNYGFFGPQYSFADNIPLPGQIGVRNESSIGAIIDAVAGINFYVDTIAFGGRTFFDEQDTKPMGLRYFLNSGTRCSNGATMSEYMDGVPKGDLLGDHVAEALASSGLPGLKGLAPGILENARDAMDPRPIFDAVAGTGYSVCQQVMCPVGDTNGLTQNAQNAAQPYILDPVQYVNGMPYQTRWVQAYDSDDDSITISKAEFTATPKCYNADGTYMARPPAGCPATAPPAMAGPGGSRYPLCTVVQPAVMPPTLQSEGFTDTDEKVRVAAAAAVAILGGIALWALAKK